MYYTTSGAYRKSKMLISGILFAVEFMLGALVNGLTAAKNFMSDRTVSGVILTVVTLGLLLMAVIAWRVMV